ncbi:hypothetical protein MGYG_06041 [Nannizzia gypsea CBS 118893]|uniref:Glycosyl transferase CAP10 domain-containing protein n=1 Tax=Arthroderma gypseum (strain ATCC MYA-4604 / CBS 118893) TaxID=535722 RepID=E4V0A5_ARTGP|nr:hypothetical protein MGYG_06041 [Nannizzia gypsea CBS 118893]EFR03042.1 hypothetical protein MGYG_06041 [Nannizzia gypsea CBS 118893]
MSHTTYPSSPLDSIHGDSHDADANFDSDSDDGEYGGLKELKVALISFYKASDEIPDIAACYLTSRRQSTLEWGDDKAALPKPTLSNLNPWSNRYASLRHLQKRFAFIMLLLYVRLELHEYLIKHTEFLSLHEVVLLPFMVSVYEFWEFKRSNGKPVIDKMVLHGSKPVNCVLAAMIDSAIIVAAEKLARMPMRRPNGSALQLTTTWGLILLVFLADLGAAILWALGKSGAYFLLPSKQEPLFCTSINVGGMIKRSLLVSIAIIFASKWSLSTKALKPSFVISILTLSATLLGYIYPDDKYLPVPFIAGALAVILLHSVIILYSGHIYLAESIEFFERNCRLDQVEPNISFLQALYIAAISSSLLIFSFYNAGQKWSTYGHPINGLITSGRQLHAQWLAEAKYSIDLQGAIGEYTQRYGLLPPPGFDIWYEYATNRSSLIIDNFDQIHQDLLPFRALAPSTLRYLTNSMSSNQWNDIAAVVVQYLPDMDIAFNLNDECRISVPWDTIQAMNNTAEDNISSQLYPASNVWSKDRSLSWALSRSNDQMADSHFTEHSRRNTFHSIVSESCPPNSPARTQYYWQHDTLCFKCTKPHSADQFLKDWVLSSDICHQPDLANLHGFFIAPSAFKVSRKLLPVFSQSKVSGFNDILYPRSWNYLEKTSYNPSDEHPDPRYEHKENTMFWRGTTSEGFSEAGEWQGMARQRLLHLTNNNTDRVSVLLPWWSEGIYSYYTLLPSEVSQSIDTNVSIGIAKGVTRCGSRDCDIQRHELGVTNRIQFDEHWKYRFLFDLDGAGFSGRFLPFLQSNSLPFRAAIFRQWFDTRITPWLHFVPQDIRFHDFWSTLAFFAGARKMNKDGNVEKVLMKPHHREGGIIAREGRKWAEETLRKEDMEIYLFRLLLEWGRLTDDRRDELGLTG